MTRKGSLACLFLAAVGFVVCALSVVSLEALREGLAEREGRERAVEGYHRPPHTGTSQSQASVDRALSDARQLQRGSVGAAVLSVAAMVILAWPGRRASWRISAGDGFMLMLLTLASLGLPFWAEHFVERFEGTGNATRALRSWLWAGCLVAAPVSCYIAHRWNREEVAAGLHGHRWVSVLACALCVATGMLALALGLGLAFTPDLSGNIS